MWGRPEWIKELRVVKDDDPLNPDVQFNNGHLMMQTTLFIGPVNFYYEVTIHPSFSPLAYGNTRDCDVCFCSASNALCMVRARTARSRPLS